jgi:hypothetical protein
LFSKTPYNYRIRSTDIEGNVSAYSDEKGATTYDRPTALRKLGNDVEAKLPPELAAIVFTGKPCDLSAVNLDTRCLIAAIKAALALTTPPKPGSGKPWKRLVPASCGKGWDFDVALVLDGYQAAKAALSKADESNGELGGYLYRTARGAIQNAAKEHYNLFGRCQAVVLPKTCQYNEAVPEHGNGADFGSYGYVATAAGNPDDDETPARRRGREPGSDAAIAAAADKACRGRRSTRESQTAFSARRTGRALAPIPQDANEYDDAAPCLEETAAAALSQLDPSDRALIQQSRRWWPGGTQTYKQLAESAGIPPSTMGHKFKTLTDQMRVTSQAEQANELASSVQ